MLPFQQRPKVGDERRTESEEILYLAPVPVPTGERPENIHHFYEVNDVYLQVGSSNRDMVIQGKIFAKTIWSILFFLIPLPVVLAAFSAIFSPDGVYSSFSDELSVIQNTFWTYGLVGSSLLISVHVWGFIAKTRERARQLPLRFNRQRRQVCLVCNDTGDLLIVPWESVSAWVSQITTVSDYGDMVFHTLSMGLENKDIGMVQPIQFVKLSHAHAVGTWEAIRQYMEYKVPEDEHNMSQRLTHGRAYTEYELRPYEGLHTWEVEKLLKEEEGDLHCGFSDERRAEIGFSPRTRWPLRHWYIRRVLTFWKMPYMIAEWGHKAGTPYIPEKVREWSAPIPPDQWAKPSTELQRATKVVEQAMNRKKNKLDFRSACQLIGGR